MDIKAFWKDVVSRNRDGLSAYFRDDAAIRWHCTNEQFTVSEYLKANCDYPGDWTGEIERVEQMDPLIVLAGRVMPADGGSSYHVVSFIRLTNGLISEMDEYWSDDGDAPEWRKQFGIGRAIR